MVAIRAQSWTQLGMSSWEVSLRLSDTMERCMLTKLKGSYMWASEEEIESVQKVAPWPLEEIDGNVYMEYVLCIASDR